MTEDKSKHFLTCDVIRIFCNEFFKLKKVNIDNLGIDYTFNILLIDIFTDRTMVELYQFIKYETFISGD
ncbi:MAG: hypothetical protein ACOC1K_02185 [Nanoarchaeota archaeon]